MSIKFLSNNFIEGSVLDAANQNAQYPLSNLLDPRRTKTWRSTNNGVAIVIDMGTAETCDHFAIVDNWQNGFGITSLTLQANGTDNWISPAFETSVNLDIDFGVAIKKFDSPQTYRFWRVNVTSTLGYCEIANIFLGTATEIITNGLSYDWSYRNNDISKITINRYGQRFIDDIGTQKSLNNLQFQIMDKDEMDQVMSVYDSNRLVKPFFVYLDLETNSLSNNDDRYNGFYYFQSSPSFTMISNGYYNTSLNLIEAK